MNTVIGDYDSKTRDVPVTFTSGDIVHERRVNACHDKADAYDAKATKERVDQVALGVAAKIEAGVILPVTGQTETASTDATASA